MELSVNSTLHGFTVASVEELPEISGTAYLMRHDASGARLLYLANDDAEKAFSISFKTPPADDTGVFHILEHSVLCGSDKFPVKEPFVNLLKSSMQTFLNAMTFPDKTMYPVASTNEQDLLNLMDVYLDAVLHPAIYSKRAIFEQEGWHYELTEAAQGGEAEDEGEAASANAAAGGATAAADETAAAGNAPASPATLAFNGVVYNEMKGALSSPDSVLYDALAAALFPDTAYRFESGGTPEAIPALTYEQFLAEHQRHYSLANSYITLYGSMDVSRVLAFLDERYLGDAAREASAGASAPASTAPAPEPRALETQAPVQNFGVVRTMPTAPENACCACGYVICNVRDRERLMATDILLDALAGSNEAPLKRALLDADLADDATAYLADSMLQPFAVVQLKGSKPNAVGELQRVIERTITQLTSDGIDPALIEAALSHSEFVLREHDFGMSDGVALAMASLSGWLYDDSLATAYLRYEDTFASLREKVGTGYFEQLARELFLENDHAASVEIEPVSADEDAAEQERLATAAAAMAPEDFERIAAEEAALRRAQEQPDSPEALATLPALSVADIGEAPQRPAWELPASTPVPSLRHQLDTRGIAYAYRYFDLSGLSFEELPYATVLALVLGKLGTSQHTAAEIDTLTQSRLGNLSFFTEVHEDDADPSVLAPKFVVSSSALAENAADLAQLPQEVLTQTNFSDAAKIKDALAQKRLALEQAFASAGHSAAMARVSSYYLPAGVVRDALGGVTFYRFLKKLLDNFDEQAPALAERLAQLAARIFADNRLTVSFAGPDAAFDTFWTAGGTCGRTADDEARLVVPKPVKRNEAFIVPTDVVYAAQGFDRRLMGAGYSGVQQVAARALCYDYLWNEVRVKGGAYGAGFQTARSGAMRFYSYRDPHLDETLARFASSVDWLASFDPDATAFDGYIVSTVAGVDRPLKARELVRRQDATFFANRSPEAHLKSRAEMVAATPDEVRAFAATMREAVQQRAICAFGNKDIIRGANTEFEVIDLLGE